VVLAYLGLKESRELDRDVADACSSHRRDSLRLGRYQPQLRTPFYLADIVMKSRAQNGSKKVHGPSTLPGTTLDPLLGEAGLPRGGS
jgi:hypothetical protein